MRLRLVLGLVALVLTAVGAGCSGSAPEGDADVHATTTAEAAATTADAEGDDAANTLNASLEQRPPTANEKAWVGLLVEWSVELGEPVEVAGGAAAAFGEGVALTAEDERIVTDAIEGMEICSDRFDDIVGDAPTARLEGVAAAAHRACDAYAAAAEAARAIVEGTGARVPLLDEWETEFERAETAMASAAEAVANYQPGNAVDLPVKRGVTRVSRIEPLYGRVAGRIAGDEVEVRCWSRRDWRKLIREMERFTSGRVTFDVLGFVGFRDHRANIAPGVCDALVALRYARIRPEGTKLRAALALAVGVLAHEAVHVSGVANEARAECFGMQLVRRTAELLGVDERYAAALGEIYWSEIYPTMPREYRSRSCRDGEALDMRPRVQAWP